MIVLCCSDSNFDSIWQAIDGIRTSTEIVKVPAEPAKAVFSDMACILKHYDNDPAMAWFKKKRLLSDKESKDLEFALAQNPRKGTDYLKVPHVPFLRLLQDYSKALQTFMGYPGEVT